MKFKIILESDVINKLSNDEKLVTFKNSNHLGDIGSNGRVDYIVTRQFTTY